MLGMSTHTTLLKSLRTPRMLEWLLAALLLTVLVWMIAPQQLPTMLYKGALVTLAAVLGYWIDRSLYPYARPDSFLALEELEGKEIKVAVCDAEAQTCAIHTVTDEAMIRLMGWAMVRRAVIVAATMLAMGLGA